MKRITYLFTLAFSFMVLFSSCRETKEERIEEDMEHVGDEIERDAEELGNDIERGAENVGNEIEEGAENVEREVHEETHDPVDDH